MCVRVSFFFPQFADVDLLQVSAKKAKAWCASMGNIPYFETSGMEPMSKLLLNELPRMQLKMNLKKIWLDMQSR